MNSEYIEEFHKKLFIIWAAILSGMVILFVVIFVFDRSQVFTPIENPLKVKNVLFTVAIVMAVGILFLKRVVFQPQKIAEKIKASAPENPEKSLLNRLRNNYIIVWAMGETILFLGFIEYIFITNFESFIIYAFVGLYAVIINLPQKNFIQKNLELLNEY